MDINGKIMRNLIPTLAFSIGMCMFLIILTQQRGDSKQSTGKREGQSERVNERVSSTVTLLEQSDAVQRVSCQSAGKMSFL